MSFRFYRRTLDSAVKRDANTPSTLITLSKAIVHGVQKLMCGARIC